MKVCVLGKGFVSDHLLFEKITDRLEINEGQIESIIDKYKPDVIINCIGKTGRPNIDQCESQKSETYMANVVLPLMLANVCKKKSIHMIQIGSGCIFFGESPNILKTCREDYCFCETKYIDQGWKETDFANPKSFYSKTKYSCDLALGQAENVATLRIRMPASSKNNPRNFINKVRGYSKVIDIPNSMTLMNDLTNCIDWVVENQKTGIYHVVNPQPLSAAEVMRVYQKYDKSHKFSVIDEEELDKLTIAKRSNCILNSDKLAREGFQMTPSKEALEKCMKEYVANLKLGDIDNL